MPQGYFNCTGGTGNFRVGGAVAFLPGLFSRLPHTDFVSKPNMDEWDRIGKNNILVNKNPTIASTGDISAPASNTNAVVTYPATGERLHRIGGVLTSFSAQPTGAELTIQSNATVIARHFITTSNPTEIIFNEGIANTMGESMVITLTAGGVGISGRLQVINHQIISVGNNV